MWPIGADALTAFGGSFGLSCTASASREGTTTPLDVGPGSVWVEEWTGQSVSSTLTLVVVDATGALLSSDLASPLAPFGQRVTVSAQVMVGSQVIEQIPMGTYRIDEPDEGEEQWWRYSNGVWVPSASVVTVKAVDLLDEVADNILMSDFVPSGTIYSDSLRLLDGLLPMGPWAASGASPGGTWADSRIAALAALADAVGRVPAMSRVGAYLPRSLAVKGTPDWTPKLGDPGAVLAAFTRALSASGVYNAVLVTGETDDQKPTRGVDYVKEGPLRWGGPFGRRVLKETNPLAKTDALATSFAVGRLANLLAKLTVPITVRCSANPALEVLDTLGITLPTSGGKDADARVLAGLVTRIELPLDGSADMTVTAAVPWRQVWTG